MKHRKRIIMRLMIFMICSVMMTGCGEKTIRGEVTEVKTDAQSGAFSFVMEQDGGEAITVVTDQDTHIFSWIDEVSESDFRAGSMEGIIVSVTGRTSGSRVNATEVQIDQLHVRNAHALEDGTQIDLLIGSSYRFYCLEDGTELVMVRTPVGPGNVYTVGVESLDALPQEAQEKIKAFYEEQGILYDIFETLEDAHDAYSILKDDFATYMLSQEIVPTASNNEIIYFLTVVTIPDKEFHGHSELRLGAAFDKETGQVISASDLFTCETDEMMDRLAEICKVEDEALITEMKANFKPEYVIFHPDNLDITFPAGALPEYGMSFAMGFEYTGEVYALLQPWAIPHGSEHE